MIITNLQGIKNLSQLREKSYKTHRSNPSLNLSDFLFKVEYNYQLRKEILPEIEKQIERLGLLREDNIDIDKIKINRIYHQDIGNIEFV